MTYAARAQDFASCTPHTSPGRATVGKKAGILRRVFDAIREQRRRETDREIASLIARRGGRITDEVEREIGRLLASNGSALRETSW